MSKFLQIMAQSGVNAVNRVQDKRSVERKAAKDLQNYLDKNILSKKQDLYFDSRLETINQRAKNQSDTTRQKLLNDISNNIPLLEAEKKFLTDVEVEANMNRTIPELDITLNELKGSNEASRTNSKMEAEYFLGVPKKVFRAGVVEKGFDADKIMSFEDLAKAEARLKALANVEAGEEFLDRTTAITEKESIAQTRGTKLGESSAAIELAKQFDHMALTAVDKNLLLIDLRGIPELEGDKKGILLPKMSTQGYNTTDPIQSKFRAEELITKYGTEINQNVYKSLSDKERILLNSNISIAVEAIARGVGSLEDDGKGGKVMVPSNENYDYRPLLKNMPDWVKDAVSDSITSHSSESGITTLNNGKIEITANVDTIIDRNKLPNIYGNIATKDTDKIIQNHTENSVISMALADENDVIRPQLNIIAGDDKLAKRALILGNSSERKINLQAIDSLKNVVFKNGTIDLLGRTEIPEPSVKARALDKFNVYMFSNVYNAALTENYAELKGGGKLVIRPSTYYRMKGQAFSTLFNEYNIARSMQAGGVKIELYNTEGKEPAKDLKYIGRPVDLVDKQSGKLKISWSNYTASLKGIGGDNWLASTYKLAEEGFTLGTNAGNTGEFLLTAIKNAAQGSGIVEKGTLLINRLQELPTAIRSAITGEDQGDMSKFFASSFEGGSSDNLYANIEREILGRVQGGNYTKKNAEVISQSVENLKLFLNNEQGKKQYALGLRDLKRGNLQTQAAQYARLAIAQASFVFQAAAALQGEGGKAISDQDRQYVEAATRIGLLTTKEERLEAIAEFMRIIGKANAVNGMIVDAVQRQDVGLLHAAINYNSPIYGIGGDILTNDLEKSFIIRGYKKGFIDILPARLNNLQSSGAPQTEENEKIESREIDTAIGRVRINKNDTLEGLKETYGDSFSEENIEEIKQFLQSEQET